MKEICKFIYNKNKQALPLLLDSVNGLLIWESFECCLLRGPSDLPHLPVKVDVPLALIKLGLQQQQHSES